MQMWDADCLEWHIHPGDPGIFGPTSPSPVILLPATPPSSSAASGSSPTKSPALKRITRAEEELMQPFINLKVDDSSAKLTREQLDELAAFRPGPGPISPRRLQQQFARVLGPAGAPPPIVCTFL